MLEHILKICEDEGNFDSIYLYVLTKCNFFFFCCSLIFYRHVQINNETALSFYEKFAFEIISTATDYYQRLEPSDAYLLERKLNKSLSNEQISTIPSLTAINVN
jgi:hypothetical protein